ncbi:dihydroorotate dehydrogenase-like protein [Rhodoblastus sp.]|uniref:dihydroorotate dehydrogenase-like protein n=1 Tax=Rhodoblastus sp. TaxID=1962975 RepID=UPI003F9BDCE4
MNLQTNYLGLSLRHPVIAGASPLSATIDGIRRLEDAGAAAIVAASVYEDEALGEDAAFDAAVAIGAESHAEVTNYLPPLPGYKGALAAHAEMIRRAAESVSVPLIASLNGVTREGWTGIAADLQQAGAAAIELDLDLFHIPTDPRETSAEIEQGLVETVREVCKAVTIPVSVKLGYNFTAPAHLAVEIAAAGASGLVLFGRRFEPDIDLETLTFRPRLCLSTANDIHVPLMWISLLAGKTSLSLAAGRGVDGPEEVVKYLLAGADVAEAASSLLRHGPSQLNRMVEGLTEWIEAHGAASVAEIRGRLRADRFAQPEALLRVQYLRSLRLQRGALDNVRRA